ncbi:amidohydrolase family protein [Roseococcus sp. SDR]|uniref:metal-dependent hydrolase family protein n=1 Tax=Roseococcus sp. SDR TaxID=2835532 RepID=UPI001BD01B37|nr:amidohydrolase family protein [Roseococcus sp. SDR]MBS7789772.1 amidohydrolase family protein [Roseococcus sp. SDR]MBV1845086.1 amidohydrolase family protein [Roseococcus sp. SDR]
MILFENARLWDGFAEASMPGMSVLVEGEVIREVSDRPIGVTARRVDLKGRTLMPGLIDAHVHVVASLANIAANAMLPDAVVAYRAGKLMHEMLMRGFTTVRDLGGATLGLRMAWEEGLFTGSRLSMCGKALSQTGGHCDFRGRADTRDFGFFANRLGSLGRLVDGVDEVRRAAREEIKGGADYIKLMANGGVASPSDPIAFFGFSESELRAAVEEAEMAQTYVAAHLYTDAAIARAVRCGVRSLEHCNLITEATAREAAAAGAIACPTLVTYQALKEEGASLGLGPESVAKIDDVRLAGLESLERMQRAGLMMAFGTDLLGPMHRRQSEEFLIRREVLPAAEILRSATSHAAKLLCQEGRLGVVAPGALADLIVVEGDPLADLALLTEQGAHLPAIMQGGRFVKNTLA